MLQNGNTALHYAADRGYTELLKVLLEQGANINMGDNVSRDGGARGGGGGGVCLFVGVSIDIDSLVEILKNIYKKYIKS